MKFVHIADMHFDCPFTRLSDIGNFGDVRRLEQRKVFRKIIDYVKKYEIELLLIGGDLYEHEYVRKSTIEYINQLFQEIPNTKILITPGNHDPYIKGSYYETFEWSENVHICKGDLEILEESKYDIYMSGFTNFYKEDSPIEQIEIRHPDKINLLLTHCDLNGVRDKNGFSYHPISESKINALHFDYVAMGHIHKTNFAKDAKVIYPGSTISFGFDEVGEHGMVVGEIDKGIFDIEFVKLDERIFEKQELQVDYLENQEELVEAIDCLHLDGKSMYEIILVGNRQFDIQVRAILGLIHQKNILKIKDHTRIGYDIEKIAKENNLRGIFVREVIKKYQNSNYTEEQIKKAIEIGLGVM